MQKQVAEGRRVRRVHEDLSTEPTQKSRKKAIIRATLNKDRC